MRKQDARRSIQATSGLNVFLGVWLAVSPFVLNYYSMTTATWFNVVLGLAVFTLALAHMGAPLHYRATSFINALFGIWIIVAPWLVFNDVAATEVAGALGANDGAMFWNNIATGVLILIAGAASAATAMRDPYVYERDEHHEHHEHHVTRPMPATAAAGPRYSSTSAAPTYPAEHRH